MHNAKSAGSAVSEPMTLTTNTLIWSYCKFLKGNVMKALSFDVYKEIAQLQYKIKCIQLHERTLLSD